MSHRTVFHAAELDRAARLIENQGSLLVLAPNGAGRSHFLSALGTRVAAREAPILSARDVNAAALISSHHQQALVCIDNLEFATQAVVEKLLERWEAGSRCVAVVDPSNRASPFQQSRANLELAAPGLTAPIDDLATLTLPPLRAFDTARFVHELSPVPLTADTTHAIVSLAEGRPRWALALVELAAMGSVVSFPRPTIVNAPVTGRAAATLRAAAARVGPLHESALAAALVLSELEPLDMAGIHDLVGHEHAAALLNAGVLFSDGTPQHWYVPPFLAAALSEQAAYGEVAAFEDEAQVRLLRRRSQGIPLTLSESLLCSRALPRLPAGPEADWLAEQRSNVIEHSIANLVGFGHGELAKSLFLRTTQRQSALSQVLRAATLGVLVGPEVGLDCLGQPPPPEHPDDYLAWVGLRSMLLPEQEQAPATAASSAGEPSSSVESEAELLAQLWQQHQEIEPFAARLSGIISRHPFDGLGLFAGALLDLESAWQGTAIAGSWLDAGLPMPRTRAHTASALPHVSGAILLSQALTCFLLGEGLDRYDELAALANRSPLREHHDQWLRHYREACFALACGDLGRAEREWGLLLACAPALAPNRLKRRLDGTLTALTEAARPQTAASPASPGNGEDGAAPRTLFRYFAGRHASLIGDGASVRHPIYSLASAHLAAAAGNNPRELMRIADQLWERDAWSPAISALSRARDVFLSRRATTSAHECADRIARWTAAVEETVPWFSATEAPTSDYQRLTDRELETAGFAARGLSNREIAARMNCSVRTVESHLAQARAKLGVSNRKELSSVALLQSSSA